MHLYKGFLFLVTHIYKISVLIHLVLQKTSSGLGLALFLSVLNSPLMKEEYGTCLLIQVEFSKTYQRRGKGKKWETNYFYFLSHRQMTIYPVNLIIHLGIVDLLFV